MTATYPIRAITADEFEALGEVPAQAFLETWPPEAIEREREVIEYDRTFAALDGDRMAGSAGVYSFQLTVPGGTAAAAGITMVAVLPSHRRRGILTALMDHMIADAGRRGEPIAILFASEAGIYGRFGFGMASMHLRLTIRRGEGMLSAGKAAAGLAARLRDTEPTAARDKLAAVYDVALQHTPGLFARDERWWSYILSDVAAIRPPGMSPLRCLVAEDDDGPRGYALYRTQLSWADHMAEGTLHLRELMAADPVAAAALWTDLLSRDLVSEVDAPMRPMDDPLLAMLADPRRARPDQSDGLWVRLVDLPTALCQRRYAADANLVLEVVDPLLPANEGRWRLSASGPAAGGKVTCERTGDPADLRLPVQVLGAAYLGGASLGQLAAAGHVAELTPGALATLATAMSWHHMPYCCMIF